MSESQITTSVVQQPVKQGDKPSARRMNDLQDVTRQELALSRIDESPTDNPILVHNDGSQEIPAHSAAEITGVEADGVTLEVERPTADNLQPALVLFTKSNTIAVGADGFMYSAFDEMLEADTDAAGVLGSQYGTQADSFELIVDNTGFLCLGEGEQEAMMRPFRGVAGYIAYVLATPNIVTGASSYKHDTGADTWVQTDSSPSNRNNRYATCVLDPVFHAFGGNEEVRNDRNEQFTPSTDVWALKQVLPEVRRNNMASPLDGKGYMYGGQGALTAEGDDCKEYDVTGNSWSAKTAMPDYRHSGAASTVNGKGHVYGGQDDLGSATNDSNYQYDATGNSWATKAVLPAGAVRWNCAVTVDDKGYVMGSSTQCQEYDGSDDSWDEKQVNTNAMTMSSAVGKAGKLNVFDGTRNDEFNIAGNSWSTKATAIPVSVDFAGAANL